MNTLIETFTLLSFVWLIIEFIRFSSRRGSGRKAEPATVEPDEPAQPQFQHQVLPFRRPAPRREPSDRELIALAKSTGYPGSKKWSFSRPLGQRGRSNLLELWETIQRTKAV